MPARILSGATRFHLYRDDNRPDSAAFQKELTARNNTTDHGLRFARFFGRWRDSDEPELLKDLTVKTCPDGAEKCEKTSPLLDWLDPRAPLDPRVPGDIFRNPGEAFKTLKAGNAGQLKDACNRLARLGNPARGATHFDLNLISRLLIGIGLPHPTGNGFLFHPTLGVPYIPGTALKQVAQDWAEDEEGLGNHSEDRLRMFGGPERGVGSVAFLDALPCEPVTLAAEQITNHYPGYYLNADPPTPCDDRQMPADWYEPIPVTMLALNAGFSNLQPFRFAILRLRGARDGDVEKAQTWLTKGLEIYGVGARTTVGFGRFMSKDALEQLKQDAIREDAERKARARERAEIEKNKRDEVRALGAKGGR